MDGMWNARIVFVDAERLGEVTAPVSVDANGWLIVWRADSPESVQAMHPPTAVLAVIPVPTETGGSDG